jgi:hypothetical protein
VPSQTAWDWFAVRYPGASVGPLDDPGFTINEDGTVDPSRFAALGERDVARRRFFFSEVGDVEAEAVRLLPGVDQIYQGACMAKMRARFLVTQGRDVVQFLLRDLEALAEDVASEIRRLKRLTEGEANGEH